ncbi:hypothetical protein AQJ66_13125 [Streptomyces bungoensis]|uniref:DUF4328 domain-containing protein n=1 Tax=Streptomyces bungoensis TaxID=285568 RepID=A0A101T502_9ACTN|nr:DUF4328 domain-containing protein [Streptomyces bungoensis]KUN85884.1 hypothetical protein AQJ66_13125 [Streptomyces bungoensis]
MPSTRLRSPHVLGRVAVAALGLVAVTDLLDLWAGTEVHRAAGDLAAGAGALGGRLSPRAHRADLVHSVAGGFQSLALLGCGVVFVLWLYRVRVNAEVFDPDGHSKARAWVIAGWVVPLANLWYPRRVILDVWDASVPAGARPRHGLINLWWALWLVSINVGRLMTDLYDSAHTAAGFRAAAQQVMAADAVDIVAAALAIRLVLRLTRMQEQKALTQPVFAPALG